MFWFRLYTIIFVAGHCAGVWAQGASTLEWGSPISYGDFASKPGKADTAAANISVTIVLGYAPLVADNVPGLSSTGAYLTAAAFVGLLFGSLQMFSARRGWRT